MESRFKVTRGGKSPKRFRKQEEKKVSRRKRNFLWLWIAIVLVLLTGAGACASYFVFKVEQIEYAGDDHYSNEELNELIFGSDTPNALYYKLFGDKNIKIPFIEKCDVTIVWPDKIQVTVYEKPIVGYISYMGCYMYFDREGVVVESATEIIEDVPEIMGLKFSSIVLNSKLEVGNGDVFNQILELTQGIQKHELKIDKIVFDSSYNVFLYVDNVKVELGKATDSSEKLYILKRMMPQLKGLKGTLKLADYDGTDQTIIFTKEK